jgi:hypothetical protein
MKLRALVPACALLAGCSFAFVRDLDGTTAPRAPITCTASRAMPVTDLALGAILGGLVAATTYAAIQRFNDMCVGECYHAWKPTTLATFLAVSPWWISAAVGFSDTGKCRDAYQERGLALP